MADASWRIGTATCHDALNVAWHSHAQVRAASVHPAAHGMRPGCVERVRLPRRAHECDDRQGADEDGPDSTAQYPQGRTALRASLRTIVKFLRGTICKYGNCTRARCDVQQAKGRRSTCDAQHACSLAVPCAAASQPSTRARRSHCGERGTAQRVSTQCNLSQRSATCCNAVQLVATQCAAGHAGLGRQAQCDAADQGMPRPPAPVRVLHITVRAQYPPAPS